jgi:hypothetical protein
MILVNRCGLTVLPDNGRIFPAGRIGSRKSLDTLCFTGNKWFVQEPVKAENSVISRQDQYLCREWSKATRGQDNQ